MATVRIPSLVRVLAAAGAMALGCCTAAHADDQTAATPAAFSAPSEDDNYKLGAGDKLRIIVYGEDDLSGTFDVDGNGFISLPLIGPMKVAGLSPREVEGAMTTQFADGYLKAPRVNVEVAQYRPFYVIGEVNKPGEYPYTNDMTVLNAVADAGGFTQKAAEGGFYVRRNGETKEIYLPADPSSKIYPGDVVRIDSSTFWDALSILGPLSGFAALGAAYH